MAIYQNGRRAGPVTGAVFVLIGIGCLWGCFYEYQKTRDFLATGLHAQGKVVEIKQHVETTTRHRNGYAYQDTHLMFNPVVNFKDAKDHEFTFADRTSSSSPPYAVGGVVEVIYTASDPQATATIDHGALNWMVPGILGLLGSAALLSGAFTVLRGL